MTFFPHQIRCYVWQTTDTAYHNKPNIPTVKPGGGSIILWAYFLVTCLWRLVKVEDEMNEAKGRETQEDNLFLSAKVLWLQITSMFMFQQDNNSKHPGKATQKTTRWMLWSGWVKTQTSIRQSLRQNLKRATHKPIHRQPDRAWTVFQERME